jgi:hypothetical protein
LNIIFFLALTAILFPLIIRGSRNRGLAVAALGEKNEKISLVLDRRIAMPAIAMPAAT